MQSLSALEPLARTTAHGPADAVAAGAASARSRRGARLQPWWAALRQSAPAIGLSGFLLALLWLGIGYELAEERSGAVQQAQRNLGNLTRAFAEHTTKTIEGADQAVRYVRNEYLERGAAFDVGAFLARGVVGPEYHLVSIIGANGLVSHSTQPFQRVDLRDREHFKVHAQGGVDKLFISRPVLGRVSNKWSIQLTRSINAPGGRFDGVVVLSMSPDYLTRFYGEVDLGRHGAIMLVGEDGVVRASASPADNAGLHNIAQTALFRQAMAGQVGTLRSASPIDGIDRQWAYRRLDAYGLIVLCGVGMDEVLADSNELRRTVLAGAVLVSLVVLAFMVLLVRHARRQIALVAALEAGRSAAQAGNRLKTRFLASVSHELRTPLNGILGYAETIRDTSPDAEARDHAAVIHASASQLHGMVNNILDLVKIETGRMPVQPVDVAVSPWLRDLHARHAGTAQARGLRLWLALQPGCPDDLHTDPARLDRVLDQLVANALKFTAEGEVSIIARGGEGGALMIDVADTGVGMSADKLAGVFHSFETALGSFDHAGQGAGLGLPLAQQLVQRLGGQLTLASTPGQGTTATVWLPSRAQPSSLSTEDTHDV